MNNDVFYLFAFAALCLAAFAAGRASVATRAPQWGAGTTLMPFGRDGAPQRTPARAYDAGNPFLADLVPMHPTAAATQNLERNAHVVTAERAPVPTGRAPSRLPRRPPPFQ